MLWAETELHTIAFAARTQRGRSPGKVAILLGQRMTYWDKVRKWGTPACTVQEVAAEYTEVMPPPQVTLPGLIDITDMSTVRQQCPFPMPLTHHHRH